MSQQPLCGMGKAGPELRLKSAVRPLRRRHPVVPAQQVLPEDVVPHDPSPAPVHAGRLPAVLSRQQPAGGTRGRRRGASCWQGLASVYMPTEHLHHEQRHEVCRYPPTSGTTPAGGGRGRARECKAESSTSDQGCRIKERSREDTLQALQGKVAETSCGVGRSVGHQMSCQNRPPACMHNFGPYKDEYRCAGTRLRGVRCAHNDIALSMRFSVIGLGTSAGQLKPYHSPGWDHFSNPIQDGRMSDVSLQSRRTSHVCAHCAC